MATITKRAKGWFVQIRRKGYEPEFKTLPTKDAAEKWAREREGRIDRGEEPLDRRQLKGMTLGDLIRRYIEEVTPTKRGADSERLRLAKMLGAPMCDIALLDLQSAPIAAYRDIRTKQVKPGTVARELGLLHTIIEVAKRDWGLSMPHNVVAQVRRLTGDAIAILEALPVTEERVFPMTAMALRLAWNRVRERAGMSDLRFHDLRHEAISRFAEKGLTMAELAVISGHRDPRMLMRYTHLRPADLAKKLASLF